MKSYHQIQTESVSKYLSAAIYKLILRYLICVLKKIITVLETPYKSTPHPPFLKNVGMGKPAHIVFLAF